MFSFIDRLVENPWMMGLILIVGIGLLLKGADWLVDGASGLAKKWGISDLVIGLTIVAFGTSMPEFVVNILSATSHHTELAITNVLGSNIVNIFVILGLTAVISPVSSQVSSRRRDIPIFGLASILVFLFACPLKTFFSKENFSQDLQSFFTQNPDGLISWKEGIILLVIFTFYMFMLFKNANGNADENEDYQPMNWRKAVFFVLMGLAGLTIGGQFIVKSATQMAVALGWSDALIGLTVVAVGTSLPELATSVIAALKHNSDLALGNCVGSCVFNLLFVLGCTACITPLPSYPGVILDAAMSLLAAITALFFTSNDRKKHISRTEGAILLVCYIGYMFIRLYWF